MVSLSERFYQIFSAGWRQRYVIIIPMLVLPFVGGFLGSNVASQYKAHTTVLIQETSKLNPFLEEYSVSAMLKERMAALGTLLHSRFILINVAEEMGLIDENTDPKKVEQVIGEISSGLSMQGVGKDMIRIEYKSNRPDNIQVTLETVSKYFIEQLLAPERSSIRDSSSFLEEHLAKRRQELEEAEEKLALYKNENADNLPELYDSYIAQLTKLRQDLAQKESALAGAKKSLGGLNTQLLKTNPVTLKLEEQIVSVKSELAVLRARYKEGHSEVQGALRRLQQLETERQNSIKQGASMENVEELWNAALSINAEGVNEQQPLLISQLQAMQENQNQVNRLSEEVVTIKSMIKDMEFKTRNSGTKEQQLSALMRDFTVKKKLYDQVLEKYEMARITGSLGIFEKDKRIKIIDRPFTPVSPINLPVVVFVIGGLFGGLFLGIGIAIILEVFDTSIRYSERLEEISGVPVISRIPLIKV
jgi:polysaccharide chain length determinant protein (PEP-CTERM system associated)